MKIHRPTAVCSPHNIYAKLFAKLNIYLIVYFLKISNNNSRRRPLVEAHGWWRFTLAYCFHACFVQSHVHVCIPYFSPYDTPLHYLPPKMLCKSLEEKPII